METRPWTSSDTDEFVSWFELDPLMWQYCGFPAPQTRGQLELHLLNRAYQDVNNTAKMRAVEDDGSLVGYVSLFPYHPPSAVAHIVVAPWYRGRGVAVAKCAIAAAKAMGITKLIGMPIPGVPDAVAQRWLRRLGFTLRFYGEQ